MTLEDQDGHPPQCPTGAHILSADSMWALRMPDNYLTQI